MDGAGSIAHIEQTPRCYRMLLPPTLLPLLILALPNIACAQWTTQIRRSCVADSSDAFRCDGRSSEGDARVLAKLAGVVSAFRESEAHAAQLGLNLTATLEHYRADITASSELAARSVGRLWLGYDALSDRMTALDATFHNNSRTAMIAAKSELLAVKNEMSKNWSSLANSLESVRDSLDERLNTSSKRTATALALVDHQTTAIDNLNQTQQQSDVRWRHQASALRAEMNSAKNETSENWLSLTNALESVRCSMDEKLNISSKRTAAIIAAVDQQTTAIGNLNQTQQLSDANWRRQALVLSAEMNLVKNAAALNISSLAFALASELNSTNERISASADRLEKLLIITDEQKAAISKLNETHNLTEVTWRQQASELSDQLNSVKNEMTKNWSSVSNALEFARYSMDERLNLSSNRTAAIIAVFDQQTAAIGNLNRTQQQSDVNWRRQASALSEEMNSVKKETALNVSSLAVTMAYELRSTNKRVNASADRLEMLHEITDQQKAAISKLNETHNLIGVTWRQQTSELRAMLNSLSSNQRFMTKFTLFIEQQVRFVTSILLSTVASVCSLNSDAASSVYQCQGASSVASIMRSYVNDVASEMRTLREQAASNDSALTTSQENLQRRSVLIQNQMESLSANVTERARRIDPDCKAPWVSYQASCYYFGVQRLNHDKANNVCQRFGGYLVRVDDRSESTFINNHMLLYDIGWAWIGLLKHARENRFVWPNGGPHSYEAWMPGEPNNGEGEERCVQTLRMINNDDCSAHRVASANCQRSIQNLLCWKDIRCGNTASFICERRFN